MPGSVKKGSTPEMPLNLQAVSGIILLVGSTLFAIGAGVTTQFWSERSPEGKLKYMLDHPSAWKVGQLGLGLGVSVTTIGLALAAVHLQSRGAGWWAYLAAALAVLAAIPWDWHVWLRAIKPVDFVEGRLPSWLFPVYTLLTQGALTLFGVALMQAGYPAWLGWISIIYPLVLFIAYLALRDVLPFTYYVLTLIIGIVMPI